MTVLAQALLALVGSNFMTLSFFTAGHDAWGLSWLVFGFQLFVVSCQRRWVAAES